MHPLLVKVEAKYRKDVLSDVHTGDTVRISIKVREENKERAQIFVGVVIAITGAGLSRMFKVRKISYGVGVERTFPLHSPNVLNIEIMRRGRPRRAKLFYLRGREGKQALRVKEHPQYMGGKDAKKRILTSAKKIGKSAAVKAASDTSAVKSGAEVKKTVVPAKEK